MRNTGPHWFPKTVVLSGALLNPAFHPHTAGSLEVRAHVHETTSQTLHFIGGGIYSYLHHCDGRGMSILANRVLFRTLPGGVIVVFGTAPSNATNSFT
uniref:Uncharacterized protein n=1 Tax=Burkholderia pseudomallei TaxID=28450 RepID=A0A0C5BEW4_BURPE|nr:hypothetical protein [Burkholderia pseudomallei]AJL34943.1 hypothetical protein pBPS060 [Burkholderia pseudomallei]